MDYCFCSQICEGIGGENAVFLQNLIYWRCRNKANKKSQRDTRTLDFSRKLFSFRLVKQIRGITSMIKIVSSSGLASIGRLIGFPFHRFGVPGIQKTKGASIQGKTDRKRSPLHVMNTIRRSKLISNP